MNYKIGDIFKCFDNSGYYIIQDFFDTLPSIKGCYQFVHFSKDLKIKEPLKLISGRDFENRITNLQIKYIRNIFDE